mgnify:CR=1 FL=1
MSERDRYIKAWDDRRARLFMLCVAVLGFAFTVRSSPWISGAFFIGAMVGAYRYYEFRCPRCHQHFLPVPRDQIWFDNGRCQGCGLRVNMLPPDEGAGSA